MDIQKFKTEVEIKQSIREVIAKFEPAYSKYLTISVNDEPVYEEFSPTKVLTDLVEAIAKKAKRDKITFEISDRVNPYDPIVNILGERHWLYKSRNGGCLMYVMTFTEDLEKHMKRLDAIKKEILDHGLEIADAQCEITLTKSCP